MTTDERIAVLKKEQEAAFKRWMEVKSEAEEMVSPFCNAWMAAVQATSEAMLRAKIEAEMRNEKPSVEAP